MRETDLQKCYQKQISRQHRIFRLGQIQQKNGKYNEALKSYTTYLKYDRKVRKENLA